MIAIGRKGRITFAAGITGEGTAVRMASVGGAVRCTPNQVMPTPANSKASNPDRAQIHRPPLAWMTPSGLAGASPAPIVAARRESVSRFSRFRSYADFRGQLVAHLTVLFQRLVDDPLQPPGTSGFRRTGAVGAWFRIALKIAAEVSPRKGSIPVAISYSTTPKENRSVPAFSSSPAPAPGSCTGPSLSPAQEPCGSR